MIDNILKLENKKVLVIGDIMLDNYVRVEPKKISSEYPGIIANYSNEYYTLGGAANVACNISKFNVDVTLFGIIGKDKNGKLLKKMLRKEKINQNYVISSLNYKTITKKRVISLDNKQILRVDYEDTEIKDYKEVLLNFNEIKKNTYDLIVISDYRKGLITNELYNKIIEYSQNNKIKVICDPKDDLVDYHDLFILKPNREEFIKIIKKEEKVYKYMVDNNIENIIVTLGKNGMKLFSTNDVECFSAEVEDICDVSGAGDIVLAFLALGYLSNFNIKFSCELANKMAGFKVKKLGSNSIDFLDLYKTYSKKIVNGNSLAALSNLIKKQNRTIVFTNGCFDLLHCGHLSLLQSAKRYGDVLIVGLNSDDSVKKIKGPGRPIIPEEERIKMLISLEFVDFVVLFSEDTPLNIIKKIKPDVLVKGNDYFNKYIVGSSEVIKNNGKVVLINLENGISTTNIVNKIKYGGNHEWLLYKSKYRVSK